MTAVPAADVSLHVRDGFFPLGERVGAAAVVRFRERP